ncbi:variable large family protein [Borrelia duttonii]|uniref:Variable large protein n=1 Tax=Borrelia duttonii (strain Ly) TaxID=412419 RepID=B5RKS8_BORDL|nr:vlp protein, alpha subfamily [Borrelia duttonii Ly]
MKIEKKGEGKVRVILLMMMMVMMGCNSGGVKGEGAAGGGGSGAKSLSEVLLEVGRSAENAFYSFIELMSDTLGLKVTKDTTKQQVGEYFNSLGGKLGEASGELEKVASKAMVGVDRSDESKNAKNSIRSAVDTAKGVLSLLKTHLESLKDIGDDKKVVDVTSNQAGVAANENALKKVYQAFKGIVTVANKEGVEKLKESKLTLSQESIGVVDAKNGVKILGTDLAATAGDAGKAALIVSAVSGEEMLESIVQASEDKVVKITGNATAQTTSLEFAKGGNAAHVSHSSDSKAAAVAGGIALRSLVKEGKLASHNANSDEKAVQLAGVTAVNKLLVALEDIIKKTVKNVLDKVKKDVDEAKKPKTVS